MPAAVTVSSPGIATPALGNDAAQMTCALFGTSLGRLLAGWTGLGISLVLLGDEDGELLGEARRRASRAGLTLAVRSTLPDSSPLSSEGDGWAQRTRDWVDSAEAERAGLALPPLDLRGTVFQKRVWSALLDIPLHETRTYSQLAAAIGEPSAARAVASACGANPVAVLVPCHRAVAADGTLGGFRWGVARKEALLQREGAR